MGRVIIDPAVLPGLLLLAAELAALATVGYIVVRVALRQEHDLSALAQGLVVGPALWGIVVNFVMYAVPGLAGAAVGWAVMLGLGATLALRSPGNLRLSARTVVGFVGVVLVLGWMALASRQLLGVVADLHVSLGLAAPIRAGAFPVSFPWHADAKAFYHYGASLLTGLLAPPAGPDLAFVWELVGVYAWVSFVLVVVTAMRQRGSWLITAMVAPLLLSNGLTTFVWGDTSKIAGILSFPVPVGFPTAGLRAALTDIYWGPTEPAGSRLGSLPDVWSAQFTLGHALAIVILSHAAQSRRATWLRSLTLAGLVGFLGILVTTLTPMVVVAWSGLEALRLVLARRTGMATYATALRSGVGLALAGLLLLLGGGALSGILGGGVSSGLTWALSLDTGHWPVVGSLGTRGGGVGLLSVGPLVAAGTAAVLARRDRPVLALASGACLLSLVWLAFEYTMRPEDFERFAGHARNLALVAFLLAICARLASLRSDRWRYVAVALFAGLVVWPTVVAPIRSLGGALSHGVQLANAGVGWQAALKQDGTAVLRRDSLPAMSSHIAAYIQAHTNVDARVLVPDLDLAVLLHTGRPSNFGFVDVIHQTMYPGPEYLDARHYLEPAAFRRLGLGYVYATDAWVAELPMRARGWLTDPDLFDLMVRDGDEALYRVRPAFLMLEPAPHPQTFAALRAAVEPQTEVYLPPHSRSDWRIKLDLLRVAAALPQAQLVGAINPKEIHLRTPVPWQVTPLGANLPDLLALPLLHEAWLYPPAGWHEVWRNPAGRISVYAPNASDQAQATSVLPPVRVRLSDVSAAAEGLKFTASFEASARREWSGQDWLLVPVDSSPWANPTLRHDRQPEVKQWFAGQVAPGARTASHTYIFDARASTLAVLGANGRFETVQASTPTPSAGIWMLALRLTRWVEHGVQEAALIAPALRVEISDTGAVSYHVYDAAAGWQPP